MFVYSGITYRRILSFCRFLIFEFQVTLRNFLSEELSRAQVCKYCNVVAYYSISNIILNVDRHYVIHFNARNIRRNKNFT